MRRYLIIGIVCFLMVITIGLIFKLCLVLCKKLMKKINSDKINSPKGQVMDKKKGSEIYIKTYKLVSEVLNSIDPMGFKPGQPDGSPIDEYGIEVAPIVAFLINNQKSLKIDSKPLAVEIDRVWNEYFDHDSGCSTEIAAEIIKNFED